MFGTPLTEMLSKLKKFELMQTAETGHGKTTRTLTATRFGPLYVFDFDGKIQGAARTPTKGAEFDPALVTVDNYKDKDFDYAFTKLKELKAIFDSGATPFATVAVDTFTMLNEKSYISAMGKKLSIKGAKATFDEWGIIATDLLNFFNVLHSLPCNVIVNCHVARTETVDGKESLGVEGMGSFRNRVAKKMTDAHYLYLDLGKFNVRAKKSTTVPANSNVPEKFIDKNGNLTVFDLSVFDDFAFKVGK